MLELYIKIFLKPISASFKDSEIIVKYYTGNTKKVHLEDIKGYSLTEEWTRYGKRKGVLLYLKDGKHLDFSEINIKDVLPITTYLIMKKVFNCSFETVKPWFFRKYKYDSLFVD